MKIGLISDTHSKIGRAKKAIDQLVENGAEYIIHAGDICRVEVLEYLVEKKITYLAVYGNNDANIVQYHKEFNLVQEPHLFKIKDTKFKLMHLPYYMSPEEDIIIFGHTHLFECDFKNGTLYINPGEACARNKPISECAMLNITDTSYNVEYYTRELKTNEWKTQNMSFERN